MAKSRKIRWLGLVAHMRKERDAYIFFNGKPESERLDIDGWIISKWMLWDPATG
jgi:hypothetical protein